MQGAPEAGLLARPRHMLQHVVHGHHVRARQHPGNRKQVGNMHQVAFQTLHDRAELPEAGHRPFRLGQRHGVKICRQRANLFDFFGRSDQEVGGLVVDPSQVAHHVADISSHAELGHPANVDGDLHQGHLITIVLENAGESALVIPTRGAQRDRRNLLFAYALTSAFARRSAYSGNASHMLSTCLRMLARAAASVRLCNASAIQCPICRISASFMPRVVSAGVPMRIPLGFSGGLVSNGIAFLFTVMPAWSSAFSASLPSMPFEKTSTSIRCVSVPPEIMRKPSPARDSASTFALATTCFAYSRNSGCIASRKQIALAAMMCTRGPPCMPGKTTLSIAGPNSALERIMPERGPRSVLCVVEVTICACGTGEG